MAINNADDLGAALNDQQESIEIEGDLKNHVLRIRATGKVAWAIAIAGIAIAVAAVVYPVPEPTSQALMKTSGLVSAGGAVAILGGSATVAAISIARAFGGIKGLELLRSYKLVEKTDNKITLQKR